MKSNSRINSVITFSDMITTIPFESTIDAIDLKGEYLREVLEHSVSKPTNTNTWNCPYMVQVSGNII